MTGLPPLASGAILTRRPPIWRHTFGQASRRPPRGGYSRSVIVDAHLDIGWNAISAGRGFPSPPAPGYLISRSSLASAGVGLVFATLYTAPARAQRAMRTRFVYENEHEAHIMAVAQVNYYRSCGLQLIRTRRELDAYVGGWRKGRLAAVMLMEGADPVETPSQLGAWTDMGVRIIGPAWGATRYSGGTGAPGGLTNLGVQLLKAMKRKKVILDLSHMADQSVADALRLWRGPIMASHSNARSIVPGDRQITDTTAAEVARRGGMLGVSFYQHHLRKSGRASLDDVVRHALHLAQVAGGPEHVGLGTDLDGGFDSRYAPVSALDELSGLTTRFRKHFSRAQVDGVMGRNWIEFLRRSLPG
jgi:membrane dipeptidase